MSYRQMITTVALDNVYHVVNAFAHGKADGEMMKYYASLVGDGITGKGID